MRDIGGDGAVQTGGKRGPRSPLDLYARRHVSDIAARIQGRILDEKRLTVDVVLIWTDVAPCHYLVDQPRKGGLQASTNVAAARRPEFFEQHSPFPVGQVVGYGWVAISFKAKIITINDEIDVLREPIDEPEGLGQGRATLEE